MPPRVSRLERIPFPFGRRPFVCRSCRSELPSNPHNSRLQAQKYAKQRGGRQVPRRAASTVPSVAAVNAVREVNPDLKELHASLKALSRDAGVYVNTSQLQLALRGLESEDPVTRVAILGLNGQSEVRRLARVLLADPLAKEQPWERQLLEYGETDGRAILLRYSEFLDLDEGHPLVRTLSIPCSILQTHKLEILLHTTASTTESRSQNAESLLVPGLDIANSSSGRSTMITYPVHKSLLYAEGLHSLGNLAAVEAHSDQRPETKMLKCVVDWSWNLAQQRSQNGLPISPINLALAEAAIKVFRQSLDKSVEYEHLWFDSGMPALSEWLTEGVERSVGPMKPTTERLIGSICDNASQSVENEAATKLQQEKDATITDASRNIINQGISIWAENAHSELRDRLSSAFSSRDWRKTKWWKLFWRVDDVGYIASDILQRAWLIEAEKEMIWLCGRIHQSGLLGPPRLRPPSSDDPEHEEQKLGGSPPAPSAADLAPTSTNFDEPLPVVYPWPQDVLRARSSLASLTVPPLQALSQSLILQTISTNFLTSSLSVLLYVSISTTSPYESGAVAATGLVYSLRRLQKRWGVARGEWEEEVREEGKRVLRNMEGIMREAVDDYKPEVDEISIEERAVAMRAIGDVKKALKAIKS